MEKGEKNYLFNKKKSLFSLKFSPSAFTLSSGCWFATWADAAPFLKITEDCLRDSLSSLDTRAQFWKWLKLDSQGRQTVNALGLRMPALI